MAELSIVESPKHPEGKQPRPFALENDRARVRKSMKREEVARLIAVEGKTQAEVAEEPSTLSLDPGRGRKDAGPQMSTF